MNDYRQGDVVYVDLNPTRGVESKKRRPCVVVSNNHYNRLLNTIIIAPISSSEKYLSEQKYKKSPLFIQIPDNNKVKGTILMQHIRSIDPKARINNDIIFKLDTDMIKMLQEIVRNFF